jgi:glycine/betaine/sarcosine/D-proline reductase family selenoprotein B
MSMTKLPKMARIRQSFPRPLVKDIEAGVIRELEKEGVIGKLHGYYYATVGNGTSVANARSYGKKIAEELKNDGVDAVILTST